MHFDMELGYVKPRFISRLSYSPISVPKDYLLGPDLVVVAAARKWNMEPKPTSSLPLPRTRERSKQSGGMARPVARRKTFVLNNNEDSFLVAGLTHE